MRHRIIFTVSAFSGLACRQTGRSAEPVQVSRTGPTLLGKLLGIVVLAGILCVELHADPLTQVRAAPLHSLLEAPLFSAPASVVARHQPGLVAEIDARIVEILVSVGDAVRQGQVLLRMDCRRLQSTMNAADAGLQRAQTELNFARAQLLRARNLSATQSISEELLDQRRNDVAIAEADLAGRQAAAALARLDVEACELRAPFDAVVTARHSSIGDFALRGQPLLEVLESDGQELSASLRNEQLDSLADAAELSFVSRRTSHGVHLRSLLPMLDPVGRTREARLGFDRLPAPIPGTVGRLQWRGPATFVPAEYLVRRDGSLGVFIADGERARFHALPDAQEGSPAHTTLPGNSLLITEGRHALAPDSLIRVLPTNGSAR